MIDLPSGKIRIKCYFLLQLIYCRIIILDTDIYIAQVIKKLKGISKMKSFFKKWMSIHKVGFKIYIWYIMYFCLYIFVFYT